MADTTSLKPDPSTEPYPNLIRKPPCRMQLRMTTNRDGELVEGHFMKPSSRPALEYGVQSTNCSFVRDCCEVQSSRSYRHQRFPLLMTRQCRSVAVAQPASLLGTNFAPRRKSSLGSLRGPAVWACSFRTTTRTDIRLPAQEHMSRPSRTPSMHERTPPFTCSERIAGRRLPCCSSQRPLGEASLF